MSQMTMVSQKCRACKRDFDSIKPAKYCSDKCRKRASRAKTVMELYGEALNIMSRIEHHQDVHGAVWALNELREAARAALRTIGDEETQQYYRMLEIRRRLGK